MKLALIIILFFTIIFSASFVISSILKLIRRETIYSRVLLIFSGIMISLISIPEFIITLLMKGDFIIVIAKFIAFSILSAFHIFYTYRDIKRRNPPFTSINIISKKNQ